MLTAKSPGHTMLLRGTAQTHVMLTEGGISLHSSASQGVALRNP
jgi:hypothetical protein